MKNLKAFTLAELLIVIGIIGVVAALTIPSVRLNASDIESISRFQKSESVIQSAIDMAKAKYGNQISQWGDTSKIATRIAKNLSVEETCGLEKSAVCFSQESVKAISGNNTLSAIGNNENYYKLLLENDVSVGFYSNSTNKNLEIYLDLNGPKKGANTMGKDIFIMKTDSNGVITFSDISKVNVKACRETPSSGEKCSDWIHVTGNNEYVNCDDSTLSDSTITCN
ncbi:type II secretion system protein [bacterium]|nr:type II secretion system protein [bacterium]